MNGVNDFTSVIDFEFTVLRNIWVQLITQNIFLMVMFLLSLVVIVIKIKDNITK